MRSLNEIRRLRKKYDLSQKDLANLSGVSQSLIAKIEAGKVEPTYSKALQLFKALDGLRDRDETKAKDLMNHRVISIQAADSVKEVIEVMKNSKISQLPVLLNGNVCGLISESTILDRMLDGKISHLTAKDLMDEAPPIVSKEVSLLTILSLLRDSPIVLVADKGSLKGIISKSDVLGRE